MKTLKDMRALDSSRRQGNNKCKIGRETINAKIQQHNIINLQNNPKKKN
jgi:hypothetical protein